MELSEVMRTTFACREWTDEPVSDETLHRILTLARFAPSGGNRQGVHVIVLRDPAVRRQLADCGLEAATIYLEQSMAGEAPWNTITPTVVDEAACRSRPVASFPGVDAILRAPVVLVVTLDLAVVASFDKNLDRVGVVSGASVYPFVGNVLLAARNEGLGGVLQTMVIDHEPRVKALLHLPDNHAVAAVVPLGHPVKQLTRLRRNEVTEFTTVDRFDGEPFSS